jgi:hypothetical protein
LRLCASFAADVPPRRALAVINSSGGWRDEDAGFRESSVELRAGSGVLAWIGSSPASAAA